MGTKLFKDSVKIKTPEDYNEFINESLKPIGFGDKLDQEFYDLKVRLFDILYTESATGGPSFDAEIFFTSVISDLNETFDLIGPALLQVQRDKE